MKHGDFTGLAKDYSRYRPGYSGFIVDFICDAVKGKLGNEGLKAVDAGAGTGIFSRMLAERGFSVLAAEPNNDMRKFGIKDCENYDVTYIESPAEKIDTEDNSCHLITMASSFHWPDFDQAIQEFNRILKSNGVFTALWNTRAVERDSITADIEKYLQDLVPEMKRKSSGRSEFCDNLTDRLSKCGSFGDAAYLESFHVEKQTIDHYIGLWRSVNDVQVQAGPERFEKFINYIKERTNGEPYINAHYQTRVWVAQKR
ncbi:bifunctional 2-polyprenyl-6-hydroxyphenol methylase/3-demethylubiquinol 3-O-methyltransferase UbiG [Desulfovibrio sp. UCD-KL4C]|uniref:class I SAM-dependent methyltransferase n=1 Tax=Desulfovibrio sp. UCD-KL4C TaxID=2578120 RepID=UPI0025C6A60D|nr:class I SAM-dependent methyltransferase [Desulfovibrio sp. UCD-KL4C]